MHSNFSGKLILVILFACLALTILFRVEIEATQYCSPDSNFYLKVAENLLQHKGLVRPNNYPFSASTGDIYFAVWPAGYPLAIAGLSFISGFSVLISSKLVNLFFLGLTFILFYKWFGKYAWLPALYFCSYAMLEVYSYTWSEGPFLFFVFWLAWLLHKDLGNPVPSSRQLLALTFCLIGLFFFRYAGLVFYFLVLFFAIRNYFRNQKQLAFHYVAALALASTFVVGYLAYNFYRTGFYTGGSRVFPEQESVGYFLQLLVQGVSNQFFLARNYFFYGYTDNLFLALLFIQLIVFLIVLKYRKLIIHPFLDSKARLVLLTGLFYLGSVIVLRKISPFDKFDYRILAPFAAPVFVALFYAVTQHPAFFRKASPWLATFMVLSLLMNLPKKFILEQLQNWF